MALQVIDQGSGYSPTILSSGGPGLENRILLPTNFAPGTSQSPGFFAPAVETPATGLPEPTPDEPPKDPACVKSNGILYCRTAIQYCEDGQNKVIYVLASQI